MLKGTPLPAGGGDPGKAYMAYLKLLAGGDMKAFLGGVTAARAKEASSDPDFKKIFPLIQAMQPKGIKVTGGAIDGNNATLLATGKDGDQTSNGTITMVKEGGAWKVEKEEWKTPARAREWHSHRCTSIDLRRKHKVGARQSAGFVRPDRDPHFPPRQVNVRMMSLLFRDRADAIRERQRLREIGKRELLLQMMLVDDAPIAAELLRQRRQLLAFQRRHAAAARDARLLRQ